MNWDDSSARKGASFLIDEKEFGSFFERIPFLFLVFDKRGKFIFLNRTCQEVLFNNRVLTGSVQEEFAAVLHPDDKERADASFLKVLKSDPGTDAPEMVIRYLCNDGLYRHFVWVSAVVGDRVFAIARDITDIVQKDRVLERFQEVANIGYWRLNTNTNNFVLSRSLKRIIGAPADFEYNADSARHIHSGRAFEAIYKKVEQCVQLDTPFDVEVEINTLDERKLWVKLTGAAERVENQLVGVFGTLQDISKRKYAEIALRQKSEELEKANSYLDQFVHVASHDLRAPLRGIMLLSSLIEEELQSPVLSNVKMLEHVAMLKGRVKRMDRLLESLLEFSVCGANIGQMSVFNTEVQILETFDFLSSENNRVNLRLNGKFPKIRSYIVPFSTVVRNLLQNSIKHSDRTKPLDITIEVITNDKGCEFRFMDNGPGIPHEYHKKVFEVFKTLRPRDEVEGSGMGLPIIQKLLESLGAKIWIDREYKNGACFVFTWNCEIIRE
jgi:signal transduction histidine kinase